MKPVLPRPATAAVAGCVLWLAACSQPSTHHGTQATLPRPAGHAIAPHAHATAAAPLPAHTGIPACDAYLSTYILCHRAAGIFAPGQLQNRYEMMRDSLLRDSLDPDIRPQLANRCALLAGSLREALQGKSCDAPQPADGDSH